MKIKMYSSNCTITRGMTQAAEKSLSKLSQWIDEAATVELTCRIEREIQHVEIVICGVKVPVVASATSKDYYDSLDLAVQRLEKQLLKNRKRKIDLKRKFKPSPGQNEKDSTGNEENECLILDEDEAYLLLKKQEEGLIFLDQEQSLTHICYNE